MSAKAITREELRQALDDSVLTHTGRSIGDLASQRVVDEVWPLILAELNRQVQEMKRLGTIAANAQWEMAQQRGKANAAAVRAERAEHEAEQMREIVAAVAETIADYRRNALVFPDAPGKRSAEIQHAARALIFEQAARPVGETADEGAANGE